MTKHIVIIRNKWFNDLNFVQLFVILALKRITMKTRSQGAKYT